MGNPPAHLPKDTDSHQAIADFMPYTWDLPEDIAALMERVTVSEVTAIAYVCNGSWSISPARRVADDMFFHIIDGQGAMEVDGLHSRFSRGDLVHWRRGVPHAASTDRDDPIRVISIHYTATIDGAIPLADLVNFPDLFRLGPGHEIESLSHAACREYALRPAGWQSGLQALVLRLLLRVIREHGGELCPERRSRNLRDLRRVMPAIEAMRETVAMPLSIPALARRCGLSIAQFRRVFVRVLGMSPVRHQQQLRLTEACRLLNDSSRSIETVAAQTGYLDPASFSHAFKAAMGMPPGAYRRRSEL